MLICAYAEVTSAQNACASPNTRFMRVSTCRCAVSLATTK
jgi:hypothetical protein